ncbi:hypothetical protein [Chitinophaga qingshengii]|uniref:Uncharacterized protein n=1 Tax=Chitinophaga qingshengii TaxID=1569794 RepID=A0ABR7TSL6_9BACT|nr:hypothetical protein [Chitinophaga qingshengii]MBC9932384.1 hypothetical protein [Chitinophaga qingshengii]
MIAWSSVTLDNLYIQDEADKAQQQGCISPETREAIRQAHPVKLYMPNIFTRVGLFILTCIVIAFSIGFMTLLSISADGGWTGFRAILIFAALLCIAALEFGIHEKKSYRSGINESLLWSAIGLILTGVIIENYDIPPTAIALLIFGLTFLATLRYADMVCAAAAFLSLLAVIYIRLAGPTDTWLPMFMMAPSLLMYLVATVLVKRKALRHYSNCLTLLQILSLITLYLTGNYYVVRETYSIAYDMTFEPGQRIPGESFFWTFTVMIPLVYLFLGTRKKDAILLRTGLILVAMIVFTIRHYHSIMPLETAMVIGGLIMTGGAWALIRYLHPPKHGFTYLASDEPGMADKLKVESLIIAQTFTPATGPADPGSPNFGGGSGGGGGASGDF